MPLSRGLLRGQPQTRGDLVRSPAREYERSVTSSGLATAKDLADIIGTLVTALAVVIGGFWAYFKFIKGRTYRPHVEVKQAGDWLGPDGALGFKATVSLKNIGAAKVELLQKGTGLRISKLADEQPAPPHESSWDSLGVFKIFTKHEWIEPGETITDELLVRLPPDPQTLQVETRLVLPWKKRIVLGHFGQTELALPWTHDQHVTIHARQVLPHAGPATPTTTGPADDRPGDPDAADA